MRVTFVAVGYEQLAVSLLAGLARREGHQVGLAFSAALFADRYQLTVPWLARLVDDRRQLLDTIRRQEPDLLAFSAITNLYPWMVAVASDAKRLLPKVKVVFGGCHASALPDACLAEPAIDFVCVGEGDRAFVDLLRGLANGGPTRAIANLGFHDQRGQLVRGPQHGFIANLDELPGFDKWLWEDYVRVGDHYLTMASRGCPYRCSFCCNDLLAHLPDEHSGPYVRHRSVDHMLAELVAAKRRYRLRFVDFEDDIFTFDKAWLAEFLPRYRREVGRPFQCLTHARFIDAEIAGWLRDAGCEWIQMGVQSVDDDFKAKHLGRRESREQVCQAIDAINASGISLKVDHIFGLPGEPAGAQESARELYASHTPDRIDTFWATYFPGTRMVAEARARNQLDDEEVAAIERGELRSYHAGGNVPAADLAHYRGYELLFGLLPLLPAPLRALIPASPLAATPARVAAALRIAVDLTNATRTRSNEHFAYAAHYLYHLGRHLAGELGLRLPAPTRRRAD